MVGSNLASGASQVVLAVAAAHRLRRLRSLIALAAVNGTSSAFFFPASSGIIPQTVPGRPAAAGQRAPPSRAERELHLRRGPRRTGRGGLEPRLGDRGRLRRRSSLPRARRRCCACRRACGQPARASSTSSGLAGRVPLTPLALGDRAPVLGRERGGDRFGERARARRREGAPRRCRSLGSRARSPVARPGLRRAGDAAAAASPDAPLGDLRRPPAAARPGRARISRCRSRP